VKFVLTASIKKAEFESLEKIFSLEVVKIAAKKSLEGLGKEIKSSLKISSTILKKIYLTSTGGAGRAVFLLQIGNKKAVLVMIRLKSDKQIGANMTLKNPKFKKLLDKNLSLVIRDIENGDFEEFDL
jgi:hypothetical protein